ncbi:MAG: DUF554 domain-containing protein [Bacteroidales bacterium]|nr:DUF554 domain-containing protein [Bacteroidales bacterium]
MIGTIINAAAIIVGGFLGLILNSKLPKKYIDVFFQVIGVFTLLLGFSMGLKTDKPLLLIFSLILGALLGTALNLQSRVEGWGNKIKARFNLKADKFSEGMVVAFLMYCMGSLTILGAIEEGTGGEPKLFYVKSLMDGFSSVALASSLGFGVLFSIIPLIIYQGALTFLASLLGHSLTPLMVGELSAVGGVLLIGLGLNILDIKKIDVLNILPALLFIIPLVYLFG